MGWAVDQKVSAKRCKVPYIGSFRIQVAMRPKAAGHSGSLTEAAALSAFDLFRGLPASRLRAIELRSEIREFPAGHEFFHPGKSGQRLFLLESGRVQTFRNLGKRKLIISELEPPAVFGEMGCVGQYMYHCTAQALAPSRIRILEREAVEKLLGEFPDLTRRLLDLVSERFVQVLLDLEGMTFRPLLPRLAGFLLEKAEGDSVKNLTHKELAGRLRVYRESATTALGELRKAGIIAVERREIRILDRARLERAARE